MPTWAWLLLIYLVMSVVTLVVYAIDKNRARAGAFRIPERTLHLLALLGGFAGALAAMRIVRHKGSKPGFVAITWIITLLHLGGWIAILSGVLR